MIGVVVRIPPQLGRDYGAQRWETVAAETVGEMIAALDARFPGIAARLTERDGRVSSWINIFIDERDIRSLDGLATALQPGQKIYIVPAVSGGGATRGW